MSQKKTTIKTIRLSQEENDFVEKISNKGFSKNLRHIIHFYQENVKNNEKSEK